MSSDQKFTTIAVQDRSKLFQVDLINIGPCRITYIQGEGGS